MQHPESGLSAGNRGEIDLATAESKVIVIIVVLLTNAKDRELVRLSGAHILLLIESGRFDWLTGCRYLNLVLAILDCDKVGRGAILNPFSDHSAIEIDIDRTSIGRDMDETRAAIARLTDAQKL
jgi:hypothetical protein